MNAEIIKNDSIVNERLDISCQRRTPPLPLII